MTRFKCTRSNKGTVKSGPIQTLESDRLSRTVQGSKISGQRRPDSANLALILGLSRLNSGDFSEFWSKLMKLESEYLRLKSSRNHLK